MKDLIIIGAGAVGGFIAYNNDHLKEKYRLIGFLDDKRSKVEGSAFGYDILGTVSDAVKFKFCSFIIGIANPAVKKLIADRIKPLNIEFINYISPSASISAGVEVGKGVIIYPNASIEHEVFIGDFVTINQNTSVGHNCVLEDYVTLAPCVGLAGHTHCMERSEMGIGAKTIQNVVIGESAMVGGQSMVIADVEENSVVVGIPAKTLKTCK